MTFENPKKILDHYVKREKSEIRHYKLTFINRVQLFFDASLLYLFFRLVYIFT